MFYNKIKELRMSKNLNQRKMGELLELSQRQVSYLESGRNEPDIQTIQKYCLIFNISADYLLDLPQGLQYPEK